MIKAVLKWTAVVVCSLSIGVGYAVMTPATILSSEIEPCNCPCDNEAPHIHSTPLCYGGLGWFSTPCKGDVKTDCLDHNCQGEEYFWGCLE